jgi:hypothetical protein
MGTTTGDTDTTAIPTAVMTAGERKGRVSRPIPHPEAPLEGAFIEPAAPGTISGPPFLPPGDPAV